MERDTTRRGLSSEDDEARHYLGVLRDGGADEKRAARARLGRIFERRGLLDEAAACYETNLAEGVRDPSLYRRLADVYRRQGRPVRADAVLAAATSGPRPAPSEARRGPAIDGVVTPLAADVPCTADDSAAGGPTTPADLPFMLRLPSVDGRRLPRAGTSGGADLRPDRGGLTAAGATLPLRLGLGALGCVLILGTLGLLVLGRPTSPPGSEPDAGPSATVAADAPDPADAVGAAQLSPEHGPQTNGAAGRIGAGRAGAGDREAGDAQRARSTDGQAGDGQADGAQAARSAMGPAATSVVTSRPPALADAAYGPHAARPGATLTLTYEVDNPSSETIEVILGGAIRLGDGAWRTDPTDERIVRAAPGRSTHTRHLRVSADAPAGTYDIRIAILSVDRQSTHAERADPARLTVGTDWPPGTPDEPISPDAPDDPPPSPVPAPAATPPPTREPTPPPATATPAPPTPAPPTSTPPLPTPTAPAPTTAPSRDLPSQAQSAGGRPSPSAPTSAPTSVPSAPSSSRSTPAPAAASSSAAGAGRAGGGGARVDCPDFPSQAAAQAVLRENPSDPHHLDRDRDGIACEKNPPPRDTRRVPR